MGSDTIPLPPSSSQIIRIYCCCDDRDEKLLDDLDSHCAVLKHANEIIMVYNHEALPGSDLKDHINICIDTADIILLLISKHFYTSSLCLEAMRRALIRHKTGEVSIVPVLLSPYFYQGTPIAQFQWLPKGKSGGKAITQWSNRQEAYVNIVTGIWEVVTVIKNRRAEGEEGLLPNKKLPENNKELPPSLITECLQVLLLCERALYSNPSHSHLCRERDAILLSLKHYRELNESINLYPDSIRLYKEKISIIEGLVVRVPQMLKYLALYTDEITKLSDREGGE